MDKYICLNCGDTFSEPAIIRDRHAAEPYFTEKRSVSPCCSDGYARVMACESCGTLIAVGSDRHGLCRKCADMTLEKLRDFTTRFTEHEVEVLLDVLEEHPLDDLPEKVR